MEALVRRIDVETFFLGLRDVFYFIINSISAILVMMNC
jgi:hypothetical protein